MDTTTGYRRNHDVEVQAYLLGMLANLQQDQKDVLAATGAALAEPSRVNYLVAVSSNTAENARGRTLKNAMLNAMRKYKKNHDRLPLKNFIEVRSVFRGGIEFKLPRRLWLSYADRVIRELKR